MGDVWEMCGRYGGDHLHDGEGGHAHGGQLLRQPRAVAAAHLIRVRVGVGVQVRVGVRVRLRVSSDARHLGISFAKTRSTSVGKMSVVETIWSETMPPSVLVRVRVRVTARVRVRVRVRVRIRVRVRVRVRVS